MEKINIAELLKDCPKGMELDCTMYDNLYFNQIYDDCLYKIGCYTIVDEIRTTVNFTEFGTFNTHLNSKCVIFPKGKTTWEGFVPPCKFKDGDVVVTTLGNIAIISNKINNKNYDTYCGLFRYTFLVNVNVCPERLATEEEKQKLFQAIKDNGYKWNAETKTLEKLVEPRFKVGDMIQDVDKYKVKITEVNLEDECYGYESMIAKGIGGIPFKEQDNWELVPDKFDITTLEPFDKVLVRHNKDNKWCCSFLSHIDKDLHSHCYKFVTTARKSYPMMIPYEGNKHLRGTTNDCDDYYKIWE